MKHTISEQTLANGAEVVCIDIPGSKSFNTLLVFRSGYRFATKDNPALYEVPHVLEHLVFDGSEKYPTADELNDIFAANGGGTNGFTNMYNNMYAVHNKPANADSVLAAALDMVFHPRLSEQSFNEEMSVVENEHLGNMGNFDCIAASLNVQLVVPELVVHVASQLERLPNVTLESIKEYHKKYYTTNNLTVFLIADFKQVPKKKLLSTIENATKDAPKGEKLEYPTFALNEKSGLFTYEPINKSIVDSTAWIYFARPGKASPRDAWLLSFFTYIATSMKSYSLNYQLRKKGQIYDLDISFTQGMESHGFDLMIAAKNDKFSEVYAHIIEGLRDFAESGITEEQFEKSKQEYIESVGENGDSEASITEWYVQEYLMQDEQHTIEEGMKMIAGITQQEMRDTLSDLIRFDRMYVSIISASGIKASTNAELLSKAILVDKKPVDEKLLADNTLDMSIGNIRYRNTLTALILGWAALLALPAWTADKYISERIIAGEDSAGFVLVVYFAYLMLMLFGASKYDLKSQMAWPTAVIAGLFTVFFFLEPGLYLPYFTSSQPIVAVHAWLLAGLMYGITGYAAFEYFREKRHTQKKKR